MEQNLDHVLTWILEKKASWLTTFSMLQRLVSEKRDSRLNVLLRTLLRRKAFLSQTVSQMGGGEGSWPDSHSLLFVAEIQLDMFARMQ